MNDTATELNLAATIGSEVMTSKTKAEPMNENKKTDILDVTYSETVGEFRCDDAKISTRDVNVFYDNNQAIHDVNLDVGRNEVIALIGPSGCGKSTFLRCLNRMNDTIDICL